MFLSQLLIVFVGIAGNHHEAVAQQLAPTLETAGITELVLADGDLAELLRHTSASRQIVRKLHVDGVVAGEVVAGKRRVRVVMYDGDGNLSSETAAPFAGRTLAKSDLDALSFNVRGALATMATKHKSAAKQGPASHIAAPHPNDTPASAPVAVVDPVETTSIHDDAPVIATPVAPSTDKTGIHVHVGLTLGIVSRSLSTDPNTIKSYSSVPVGTGGFDLGIDVGARTSIAGNFEHTLVMHSLVTGDSITSSIGRWQVLAGYDLLHGDVSFTPVVGVGARSFAIDSTAAARTPDTSYSYLVLGASISKSLGSHFALRGIAALEPVVGGSQPITTVDASRWGFDVGAALEVKPSAHAFLRAAFDYQQFAWSWTMVGSATDGYPTATLAGGAAF